MRIPQGVSQLIVQVIHSLFVVNMFHSVRLFVQRFQGSTHVLEVGFPQAVGTHQPASIDLSVVGQRTLFARTDQQSLSRELTQSAQDGFLRTVDEPADS